MSRSRTAIATTGQHTVGADRLPATPVQVS